MRGTRTSILLLVPLLLWAMPAWADGPQFTNTCASISWTANTEPDLAGYKLYDQISLTSTPTVLATVGPSITSMPCPAFNAGQHYLSLTAFDTSGNESAHSSLLAFVIVKNQVTDLRVTVINATDMTLTWTEVDDGTANPATYDVRFATPTMNWGTASSVTSGTCSTPVSGTVIGATKNCTVTGLALTTDYQFQLVPYRGILGSPGVVFGPLSNIASGTTGSTPPVGTRLTIASDTLQYPDGALPPPWVGGFTGTVANTIHSNTVIGTSTLFLGQSIYNISTPVDQWIRVVLASLTAGYGNAGVLLRAAGPPGGDSIIAIAKVGDPGSKTILAEVRNGVFALLVPVDNATSWAPTDEMLAEVIGQTVNVYRIASGVQTLILTGTTTVSMPGFVGFQTFSSMNITDIAMGAMQMGGFVQAATETCGCDTH